MGKGPGGAGGGRSAFFLRRRHDDDADGDADATTNLISGAFSESAKVGQPISGTIGAGSYCVALYDIGNVVGADEFVITISHS